MAAIVHKIASSDSDCELVAQMMEDFRVEVFSIVVDRHGYWHVWGKSSTPVDRASLDSLIEKGRERARK